MLGFLVAEGRGAADRVIADTAARLRAEGWPLAGAVQVNREADPARKCDMDLHILAGREVVRISQDLGALSRGCRLDPSGLERAVGLVAAAVAEQPALLIVNKFGKQEIDGRGFRPVIAEALGRGVPVLTAVNPSNRGAFLAWAGEFATELEPSAEAATAWCRTRMQPQALTQ